jgi:hypothetical protein
MEAISLLHAKEEAQAALARVAASQARELAARKAREAVAEDLVAAEEAADGQASGAGHDTDQVVACPVEGTGARPEVVTREVSPLPCRKPPRKKNEAVNADDA